MIHYSILSSKETFEKLESTEKGLTKEEIKKRLEKYGPNELQEPPKDPWWKKLLNQFKDFLILILIAAVIISAILGEWLDSIAILAILLINAFLGFIQEYRAEQALEALKKMSASYAKVMRNGVVEKIALREVVPGDVFLLETGDKVPADGRLFESVNLKISESILTGESEAIHKQVTPIAKESEHLTDMNNLVFKDTLVMYGRGMATAYATGMKTEVGKIASKLLTTESEPSPLDKEIDGTGKRIASAVLIICLLVFAIGIFFNSASLLEVFLTSISLAVAAIPEGLPAVVTIVLALGIKRLAQHNAIVKRLNSVETLGSTTHICSDKTGTLTQNAMVVSKIYLPDSEYQITGEKNEVHGTFLKNDKELKEIRTDVDLMEILKIGVLCNDTKLKENSGEADTYLGDPTEIALFVVAQKAGVHINEISSLWPRISEIPFSSERAMMTTINTFKDEYIAYVKGAPEKVIEKCAYQLIDGKIEEFKSQQKKATVEIVQSMSKEALRNLAFAYKKVTKKQVDNPLENVEQIENDLVYVGVMGQKDPLRKEVKPALLECQKAGIRVIMITGDHKLTAYAIAKELGLVTDESQVMEGDKLVEMSNEKLKETLEKVSVFARVLPKDKLRIVELLKEDPSKVVAVTGDGVNDSLAIKSADIGIAMGIEGTDVTREVADMVLQDDNFATIVKAVKQGRVIFANLVKFIRYLLSCNISEVMVVLIAVIAGLPLPLLPIQLLWVNLVTDGLPALALGMDPPEKAVMNRPPRDLKEGILSSRRWIEIILEGVIMSMAVFFVFIQAEKTGNIALARTATFVALCSIQLIHSLSNRSESESILTLGFFTNKTLIGAILGSFALQMLVVYTPIGNRIFGSVPMPLSEWELIIGVSFIPMIVVEGFKVLKRKGWFSVKN